MKVVAASVNNQKLFTVVRETGGRRTYVSGTKFGGKGEPDRVKQQRFNRQVD